MLAENNYLLNTYYAVNYIIMTHYFWLSSLFHYFLDFFKDMFSVFINILLAISVK